MFKYSFNFEINPTVSNEFATAAFRFGHTLVNSFVRRCDNQYKIIGELPLSHVIFRPVEAYNQQMGGIDTLTFGYLLTPASKFDPMINNILRNHLFQADKLNHTVQTKRYDLSAVNINRGRDHGLPSMFK